jgi:hypothetical protein
LGLLSQSQRVEIIAEYRAHMSAEIAAGTPELEVLRKFGKPAKVAHQFYTTYGVYERFRKWQYAALTFMVLGLAALYEYTFGHPEGWSSGSPPASGVLWTWSFFVFGPLAYWVMAYRCRGQKTLPLLAAGIALTVSFCYSQAKLENWAFSSSSAILARFPTTEEEARNLAAVTSPLEKLVTDARDMRSPENFVRKLVLVQPKLEAQRQFLWFCKESAGKYLVPIALRKSVKQNGRPAQLQIVEFGYTDSGTQALHAWKLNQSEVGNLLGLLRPDTIEFTTGLKKYDTITLLRRPYMWLSVGSYVLYVAAVGILFTYLHVPWIRRRRGLA